MLNDCQLGMRIVLDDIRTHIDRDTWTKTRLKHAQSNTRDKEPCKVERRRLCCG